MLRLSMMMFVGRNIGAAFVGMAGGAFRAARLCVDVEAAGLAACARSLGMMD